MNVYKCWYRVIVVLLSHQIIICQNATSNISFSWRTETIFFFTLRSLHLQSMKGHKIGPLK